MTSLVKKKNQSGAALDIAIFLLAFLTIVAASFITLTTIASKKDLVEAKVTVRAVKLESALYEFVDFHTIPTGYDIMAGTDDVTPLVTLDSAKANNETITITARESDSESGAAYYLIIKFATVGEHTTRTVLAKGETTWNPS